VTMPHRLQNLYSLLSCASAELAQRLGRAPNASELAAELGISREYVITALTATSHYDSPSTESCDGHDQRLASAVASFENGLEEFDNGEVPRRLLAGLPRNERAVLLMRFGGAMTQVQIAERLGISQLHVYGLLAKALGRIRER